MPRFYLDSALRAGSSVLLPEDSAHHAVHVLRVQTGDEVTLFNGRGGEYGARVASIQRLKVLVDVLAHRAVERESPLRVVLVQGVSAGERMDFTVRKGVELGVAEIQPVLAASSVARPKGERAAARQAHWQKIAIAACEQCGRNRVPPVAPLLGFGEWLAQLGQPGDGLRLMLSPQAAVSLGELAPARGPVFLLAGPEGGLAPGEMESAHSRGFAPVRLGPRVLRTETAALAALAAIQALWGDF